MILQKLIQIILFGTFVLSAGITNASYDFNPRCQEAYLSIFELNFDHALELIDQERISNPNNHITLYLENNIDFVNLLITNDIKEYQKRSEAWESRINKLGDLTETSPYYKTCLAECKLQRAVVHINQREFFYGILELNRAYRLLVENAETHPEFIPNQLYLGMLHAIFGAVPENYKWGIELLNFEGDITKGISEVEMVIDAANRLQEYSHLRYSGILMFTFLKINYQSELLPDENLLNTYAQLIQDKPSPMLMYAYCKFMLAQNDNDHVLDLLENYQQNTLPRIHNLDLIHGMALLRKLDSSADAFLEKFITNHKGKNYKKQAIRFKAWSGLIQGDTSSYIRNMNRCLIIGNEFIDQDKAALREAESKKIPNVPLLKARLLFDGGYYKQAKTLLNNTPLEAFTPDELLDYTYRLGRIYHQMGQIDKAIENYKLTIKNGSLSETYYAANSALKLGAIYEKMGQYDQAVEYYELARNMNNIEYKSSINHKAKVGIKRIDSLGKG
ncbi:MAG: tetratricopeptide repeat protein [Bacteroidales bacterium]|nr:tetratricopeptide repeat protein [Bacteroidales bacterium]